jgi:hypothetical protein
VGLLGSGSVTVRFCDAIEVVTLRSLGCCLYTRLINKAYDLTTAFSESNLSLLIAYMSSFPPLVE